MAQATLIYSFKTHEFEHQEKGLGWYFTAGIIGLAFITYFYYIARDWFGVLTIVIITALIMYFASLKAPEIEVEISDRGINIGNVFFSYSNLKRFWIADHSDVPELHFETTAYLNRYLTMLLRDQDPQEISEMLGQFLPESEPEPEALSKKIARKLKF